MEFKPKYYGILEYFDFVKINKDNFNTIVEAGIFDEFDSELTIEDYKDWALENLYEGEVCRFGNYFVFNGKEYYLKDKDLISDIIYVKNWLLNSFRIDDVNEIIQGIEILVNAELNVDHKLKVIEENYKKNYSLIKDKRYYALFKEGTETDGYHYWQEYIYDVIIGNEDFDVMVKFLGRNRKFLKDEIENQWNDYFIFSHVSDYCERKKNSILNITSVSMEENQNKGIKNIDLFYQISLLEEIRSIDNWEDLSATKKGEILKLMLGKSPTNIRDVYLLLDKPKSNLSEKHLLDIKNARKDIKNILG